MDLTDFSLYIAVIIFVLEYGEFFRKCSNVAFERVFQIDIASLS